MPSLLQNIDGMIVAYLPEDATGPALWKNRHDNDGVLEDLEEHEVDKGLRVRSMGVRVRMRMG